MKKKTLFCWVLTLMLAVSIFQVPVISYAAGTEQMYIEYYMRDYGWSFGDDGGFEMSSGDEMQLRASHLDDNYDLVLCPEKVTWTSSNTDVVEVVADSSLSAQATLKVNKQGEATITAKDASGNTAEFKLYAPIQYENARYSVSSAGKATLRSVSSTQWSGSIPSQVNGYPVTAIASTNAYDNEGANVVDGTTVIYIPASVTYIDTLAFQNIISLQTINVTSSNPTYYSVDGVLFSNIFSGAEGENYKTLHTYPMAKQGTRYTIPDGTQRIEEYSFDRGSKTVLKEVVIPQGLELGWYQMPFYNFADTDDDANITGWNIKLYIMGSNPAFEEYAGTYKIPWERYAVDIAGGSLSLKSASAAYTGKAITPAVTVTVGGKTLKNGTDYTVAYKNNVNPGTATVTVTGKSTYKGTLTKNFTITAPSVTAVKSVTANLDKSKYNSVLASWNAVKVAGATVKYKVEYKVGSGKWKTAANGITKTSYTIKKLAAGKKVTVRVIPSVVVNGKTYSAAAKSSAGVYTLKKLSKPTVKKASKTKIKVSWKNINGETGYQIYKSQKKSKGFKLAKTVKSSKAKSTTFKVTKKKTYYYKVRAYKTVKVGGKTYKVYGPWSAVKSFKLK